LRLPSGSLSSLNRRLLQDARRNAIHRTPSTEHPHKLTKRFVKELLNPVRADGEVYRILPGRQVPNRDFLDFGDVRPKSRESRRLRLGTPEPTGACQLGIRAALRSGTWLSGPRPAGRQPLPRPAQSAAAPPMCWR